jgi:hypothetical protein
MARARMAQHLKVLVRATAMERGLTPVSVTALARDRLDRPARR